jgi:hypothetical protein
MSAMSSGLVLPARLWPAPERDPAAPPRQLVPVLAVAVLGGLTLHVEALGLASLLTGTAVLAVALRLRGSWPTAEQLIPAVGAVLLLGVATVRGAEWLVALCVLGAWALATLALVGGRTWTGVILGVSAAALVPRRALLWFGTPLRSLPLPAAGRRTAVVVAVSAGLLLVFGLLFGAADPAYAHLLHAVVPSFAVPDLAQRLFLFAGTGGVMVLAAYLAQRPPAVDALAPAPAAPVRPAEWLVPLTLLDGLFVSFVAVQLSVLFGGRDHVLRTTGLTYSAYARHGFWQLLVVTGLTLLVIAVAVRLAPRVTARERVLVRVLLGALCLLCLVVVASALHRMSLYEREYGWTRLRLFVTAVELALGAVLVLVLAAGIRLDGRSLPRAVVGVAAVTLLGLAAVNPDAYIARHDVDRYRQTGRIDTSYLSQLSADAVPVLLTLPPGVRECAVLPIAARIEVLPHPWYDDNLARHHARRLLEGVPLGRCR